MCKELRREISRYADSPEEQDNAPLFDVAMLLAIPAVALAAGDQFQDTLWRAATTQTINAGGSFTNTYYVDAGGPDDLRT